MGLGGWGQDNPEDLRDVSAAKAGIMRQFPGLKEIVVVDVWLLKVKTRKLREVPHAALRVQKRSKEHNPGRCASCWRLWSSPSQLTNG
eukprot:COSAG04_NODE_524_length_13127_cov_18.191511_23_plen_88_part_00